MKRFLPALLLLLPLLTGCDVLPYPRELESTLLVGILGVDWGDRVTLTAAEVVTEQEAPQLLTASGPTLEEGRETLKRAGEEYLSLTHVTQIIVGKGSDLRSVLEGILAEREVGQTATVWLTQKSSAQKLMESVGGGAKRLNSIELNYGLEVPTVLEALVQLEEKGEVNLPVLVQRDGTLELAGTCLWKEEANDAG